MNLRPARTSKGRRATDVNTTSGANPSGGLLAALPAFYLRTSRLLRSHQFAHVRTTGTYYAHVRDIRARAHAKALSRSQPRSRFVNPAQTMDVRNTWMEHNAAAMKHKG